MNAGGNGGTEYLYYERAILNAPGVMRTLTATTFHPYAPGVWVPWQQQPWGNTTFFFPNQTNPGLNSTVAMIKVGLSASHLPLMHPSRSPAPSPFHPPPPLSAPRQIMAGVMTEAAAAAGISPPYTPAMHPSEMGYNLEMRNAAGSGWTVMHGALIGHLLVHLRSEPVTQWVRKAFIFAAYDGCCAESDGFFGLWRPALLRIGPGAQVRLEEGGCGRSRNCLCVSCAGRRYPSESVIIMPCRLRSSSSGVSAIMPQRKTRRV